MAPSTIQKAKLSLSGCGLGYFVICIFMLFFLFRHISPSIPAKVETNNIQEKAKNLREAATNIHQRKPAHFKTPIRLINLLHHGEIVGDKLIDIQSGKITIEEAINKNKQIDRNVNVSDKPPPIAISEVIDFLSNFIHELHLVSIVNKKATHEDIWQSYHDLAIKKLYPWDQEYLQRMPKRRYDDSIFLSIVSYRDEYCLSTISNAYKKSKYPEKLFVGLVQQNCEANCISGLIDIGVWKDVGPDENCHKLFCESEEGKPICDAGQVRAIHAQESEALGPYAARYFASKLWEGEQWYIQIDSHMTFLQNWDAMSLDMLRNAPTSKAIISHYPPKHSDDLAKKSTQPASRICGPSFSFSHYENHIIVLPGASDYDKKKLKIPRFAPFVAAGFIVTSSDVLREVPFDPFLPWIFMGEEIMMSARFWTHGYDIYSPTHSVVGHIYGRDKKPKFWQSLGREYYEGVFSPLQMLILNRVKHQLGYPESSRDLLQPRSLLTAIEHYSMGTERKLEDFMRLIGVDINKKEIAYTAWCETGQPPKEFEKYSNLYT